MTCTAPVNIAVIKYCKFTVVRVDTMAFNIAKIYAPINVLPHLPPCGQTLGIGGDLPTSVAIASPLRQITKVKPHPIPSYCSQEYVGICHLLFSQETNDLATSILRFCAKKESIPSHTRQTKTRSKFNRLLRTHHSSSWAEPDLYDLPFFVEVGLRLTMIVAGKIPSLVAHAIVAGEILSFGGQFLGKFRLIPRHTPAGG